MILKKVVTIFILSFTMFGYSQSQKMVLVSGGKYVPLYGRDSAKVEIDNFKMDIFPVTNREYIAFLKENPKWRKSNIKTLFAEGNYLMQFENDLELKTGENLNAPVTNVSWFAAKKYCECQGKRLPTLDEWEYAAMADATTADARKKDTFNEFILGWYEKPRTYGQDVGSTFKNYWGIYDMHGLVWEWLLDFNSVLVSGESRRDLGKDNNLFCGSAAIGASDLMNYAAFMRYAFRGSIKGNYAIKNLGFRCAKDVAKN